MVRHYYYTIMLRTILTTGPFYTVQPALNPSDGYKMAQVLSWSPTYWHGMCCTTFSFPSPIKEVEVSETHSLNDVLKEHVASNTDIVPFRDQQLVPIRRREIWKDVLRCINTPNFVFNRGLKVRFVGEEAVDAGGPLRYKPRGYVCHMDL